MSPAAKPSEAANTRNHALDAARGVLMMLGIVLHTSNIYAVEAGWLLTDPRRAQAFDRIGDAIHVFRMPAFFWIAGYFCGLTYSRASTSGLLRKRLPRLAIPLLTAWLTLNVIQEVAGAALTGRPPLSGVSDGVPLFHLWFLVDLLVFTSLMACVLPALDGRWADSRAGWPMLLSGIIVASYVVDALARTAPMAYMNVLGLTSIYRLATYAPFFIVGVWMYRAAAARQSLSSISYLVLPIAIAVAIVASGYTHGPNRWVNEIAELIKVAAIWFSVAAVLNGFQRFFSEQSRATYFFSDASYTVYLFHHVLVVVFGLLLIQVAWSPWVKFTLIICATVLLTSMWHIAVVRRVPLLRFLFNGK